MDISEFCPAHRGGRHEYGDIGKPKGDKSGKLQWRLKCKACNHVEFRAVPFDRYPEFGAERPQTKQEQKEEALSNAWAAAEEDWPQLEVQMKEVLRLGRLKVRTAIWAGTLLREIRSRFLARSGFRKWTESHGLKTDTVNRFLLLGRIGNNDNRSYATIAEAVEEGRRLKAEEELEEARKEEEAGKAGADAKVAKAEGRVARLEGMGGEERRKLETEGRPEPRPDYSIDALEVSGLGEGKEYDELNDVLVELAEVIAAHWPHRKARFVLVEEQ